MKRIAFAAAAALGTGALLARPAAADVTGDAWTDGAQIGAGAGGTGGSGVGGGGGGGGGGGPACTYTPLTTGEQDIAVYLADKGWGNAGGQGTGRWFRKVCPDGSATVVWIPTGGVDPAVLAQQALDRTVIPLPGIQLNPPAGADQVVNLATWMWLDNFRPVSASASAAGVTVTVTARPVSVSWSMGNGDTVRCASGGTAYSSTTSSQAPSCSYTYRRSSASAASGTFPVRATAAWRVTWVASGIAASGDFGTVDRTAAIAVRVAEIQAVHE